MELSNTYPKFVSVGLNGLLITFADHLTDDANRAALALRAGIDALGIEGVSETTTSLTSTFVIYDPQILPQDALRSQIETLLAGRDWGAGKLPANRRLWHIPAVFDDPEHGPQLAEAARLAGVDPAEAVAQICRDPLRVLTIGFAPGQPYLGTLPENWNIPRQTGLTKQVPMGAITVAIRQIVLFAGPSPTGWRQVGQCGFRLFRPESEAPFVLSAGDEIKFFPVSAAEFAEICNADTTGDAGATWEALP